MRHYFRFVLFYALLLCSFTYIGGASAQQFDTGAQAGSDDAQIFTPEKRQLLKAFVSKMKTGFARADQSLSGGASQKAKAIEQRNILPDGESLLLQPVFTEGNIRIDGAIYGLMRDGEILLSLRDVAEVLQMPIIIDGEGKTAKGWYIREDKTFQLDLNAHTVRTDVGVFTPSDAVTAEDGDILVPVREFGQWVDFKLTPRIATQDLNIEPAVRLPIQERYMRRKAQNRYEKVPEPSLPLSSDEYRVLGVPTIDVATRSSYQKRGTDASGDSRHNATIRAVGDAGYGTLTTQAQLNETDNLSSLRVNYQQESTKPELLGPLKARRFELGDVTTARVPLGGVVGQELGVRVTNTDELRTFTTPTTGISGTGFPGWDVELYRNNQLIGFRAIGDDGFYNFENVNLFVKNNNFKLIFYGPQGEVREENVFVPVNNGLTRGESVYDVSVSLDGENTYNDDRGIQREDDGALNVSAIYEKPIAPGTTVSAGLRSSEHQGERNTVGNVGMSTTALQTLVNAGIASDDEGDLAAELTLRRDFGEHQFSNTSEWRAAHFDTQSSGGDGDIGVLRNNLSVTGPIPINLGRRPRYNLNTSYSVDTNDDYALYASAGFNTSIKRFTFNEQLLYRAGNTLPDDISSITGLTGAYGLNRLRLSAEYAIKPESELRNVLARYNRRFSNKLDFELGVTNRHQLKVTEYSAKLDWQAGFIRLSPTVTYDTQQDFFAGLNTRFGLLRDPSDGRVKMYDRNITNLGGASAFVFLDKDGDGVFNGEDEPIEGAVVRAPQNGGLEATDEHGIALFSRMGALRLTDVYLDQESLEDPSWVSGFEGISVIPREGYIAEVKFPVHYAGELDGSVYIRAVSLPEGVDSDATVKSEPVSLRGVTLALYNQDGEAEQTVTTDSSGFYYFTLIPPGRYLLIIDEKSAEQGHFVRPEPQQIEIGYDGTVIYGNDLYVDTGGKDVPSAFLPDLDDYKARHPNIDFAGDDYDLVLNLGDYNSRLLMSVIWYRLKSRFNILIGQGHLFVPPAESYADAKTGKHTLRIGFKEQDMTMDHAYSVCRSLMARNEKCKVEIFPSYMKQAHADTTSR